MRTGVLANSKIITLLNEKFVNVFVLSGDLPELQQGAKGESVSKLATTVAITLEEAVAAQRVGRSVNSFVLSPQLELMGHLPYRKPGEPNITEERYVKFLHASLDGKLPGSTEDASEPESIDWDTRLETAIESGAIADKDLRAVLTADAHEQRIISVFRTPETDTQNYTIVEIDAMAFKDGGVLNIEVQVGEAAVSGAFYLFAGDTQPPAKLVPDNALASVREIPTDERETITFPFERGRVFTLAVTGNHSQKGKINGFLANISVQAASEK
ncbi:hypothetical protein C6503_27185 [Candidatus Poribacteria bacterium]|nr:MAG: hypothetical protein C6503_27185 [Candidatus Poribacteria bacterium]